MLVSALKERPIHSSSLHIKFRKLTDVLMRWGPLSKQVCESKWPREGGNSGGVFCLRCISEPPGSYDSFQSSGLPTRKPSSPQVDSYGRISFWGPSKESWWAERDNRMRNRQTDASLGPAVQSIWIPCALGFFFTTISKVSEFSKPRGGRFSGNAVGSEICIFKPRWVWWLNHERQSRKEREEEIANPHFPYHAQAGMICPLVGWRDSCLHCRRHSCHSVHGPPLSQLAGWMNSRVSSVKHMLNKYT